MDKKDLTERDICSKFSPPALVAEFEPERKWWAKRKTTEQAWRVPVAEVREILRRELEAALLHR